MINVSMTSNVNNIILMKYIFTKDYCFNDIYEHRYDLVREISARGAQIILLSHDSIKQLMYFKIIFLPN